MTPQQIIIYICTAFVGVSLVVTGKTLDLADWIFLIPTVFLIVGQLIACHSAHAVRVFQFGDYL